MAKKKDLQSLGEAYGAILDQVIVSEEVSAGTIGEAPLQKGGPSQEGGFKEAEVDIEKAGEKENAYNIKGLSYGNGNDPGNTEQPISSAKLTAQRYGIVGEEDEEEEDEEKPDYIDLDGDGDKEESMKKAAADKEKDEDEEGPITTDEDDVPVDEEEDEESSQEVEKIAEEGLNNFMKRKSVFDKLYDKVMVNENYDMPSDEEADLDALGLDDAETDDEVEGEVTITLDKELAKALHDVLMAAMGGDELEDEVDAEVDDELGDEDEQFPTQFEEDEEGEPTAMNTHYNDGKQNKVGNLKTQGGAASTGATGKVDAGSNLNTHYNDGKQNKVGNLKTGSSAFEQ